MWWDNDLFEPNHIPDQSYTLAFEIKKFLERINDAGTEIHSCASALRPKAGLPKLKQFTQVDLWVTIGGIYFQIAVRKAISQMSKEGATPE